MCVCFKFCQIKYAHVCLGFTVCVCVCVCVQEKTPIKVINFTDVSDILADGSQGKQNCFRFTPLSLVA